MLGTGTARRGCCRSRWQLPADRRLRRLFTTSKVSWAPTERCEAPIFNRQGKGSLNANDTYILTSRESLHFCAILATKNVAYLASCRPVWNGIFVIFTFCSIHSNRKKGFRAVLVVNGKGRRPLGMPVLMNDFCLSPGKRKDSCQIP